MVSVHDVSERKEYWTNNLYKYKFFKNILNENSGQRHYRSYFVALSCSMCGHIFIQNIFTFSEKNSIKEIWKNWKNNLKI